MSNLGKRIIIIVLILAVVAVGIALWWKKAALNEANNLAAVNALNPDAAATPEPVELVVNDQFPGPLVFVSSVKLPNGGWVVVHRDDNGAPGAVVGAGYFDQRLTAGEVNLNAPSKEGETYHAVLYRDNGDFNFDPKTDTVYRNGSGLPVLAIFRVTKNLPENKG